MQHMNVILPVFCLLPRSQEQLLQLTACQDMRHLTKTWWQSLVLLQPPRPWGHQAQAKQALHPLLICR